MLTNSVKRSFSTFVRNNKMKLTIRTPYKTLLEDFEDFGRVLTKIDSGVLNIENQSPPGLYVIQPGLLNVRLNKEVAGFSGDIIHNGGWIAVNMDNSCEISLMDAFEKEDLRADQLGNWEMPTFEDPETMKYVGRIRESSQKVFSAKMV